jgi:type II secretory ATPase GspE/PulE/Tfp pilus assembly ATPase PilB-like protein
MEQMKNEIIAYLKGELSDAAREAFERELTRSDVLRAEVEQSREVLEMLNAANDEANVRIVHGIIQQALQDGASDVHVVPEQNGTLVHFRLDGVLHEVMSLPRDLHRRIVDRVKVMADCDVAERQLPQEGRIAITHGSSDYDLRVSLVPAILGERVVIRILDRSRVLVGLERLGFSAGQQERLRRLARLPAGMLITAGPTGAGKTTLLYSFLMQNSGDAGGGRCLLTVEDPVEYLLTGVGQVAVNRRNGLTFAAALRALLRQDPDVVMIGEVRDLETVDLALATAVTGHLVLFPLHTTSALGVFERLRNMGAASHLVADTTAAVMFQRLVRTVCRQCATEHTPDAGHLKALGLTPADGPFRRGAGCEACRQTGYKGRTILFEALEVTPALARLVAAEATPEDLWTATFGADGGSIWDDAREKVRGGVTTAEEVLRVLMGYPFPPDRTA